MPTPTEQINPALYATISGTAELIEVPYRTVRNWVRGKRLATIKLADGTDLISVAEAEAAKAEAHRRGRPGHWG